LAIETETLINLTADVTAAHLGNNPVPVGNVAGLIETIFAALQRLGAKPEPEAVKAKPQGAVSVRSSIKPSHLISMIDGKPYKMLKRHLSLHGYTPESYREAFGLPKDYPMVAADYAAKRRTLALSIGLGRKPKAEPPVPVKKPRARKPKAVTTAE
jgi:predicted transcriptional regulator